MTTKAQLDDVQAAILTAIQEQVEGGNFAGALVLAETYAWVSTPNNSHGGGGRASN